MIRALLFGTCIGFGLMTAAAVSASPAPTIVATGSEHYMAAPAPFPKGIMIAVLTGDPKKASSYYAMRLKLPDGVRIPPHTHGSAENVTVLSGTFLVGLGKTFDASKLAPLPAGSFVSVPAGVAHYAMAKGAVVLEISGIGPQTDNFLK